MISNYSIISTSILLILTNFIFYQNISSDHRTKLARKQVTFVATKPVKISVRYQIQARNNSGKISLIVSAYEADRKRYKEIWKGAANEPPKQLAHLIPKETTNPQSCYVNITYDIEPRGSSMIQVKVFNQVIFNSYQAELPRLLRHLERYIEAAA